MAKKDAKAIIEANIDKIEQWTKDGLTMKQIAKNLGLTDRTLYRHKQNPNSLLNQCIKSGRAVAVKELENTLYKSACGYTRKAKKYVKVKRCIYDGGKKLEEWEEMQEHEEEIYYPPDTGAGIFLLKNWSNYMNEPATLDIRKKELKLREKQIDANMW